MKLDPEKLHGVLSRAETGDEYALIYLGWAECRGTYGVPNITKGEEYLKAAMLTGSVNGAFNYAKFLHIYRDKEAASRLMKECAQRGFAPAQYRVGQFLGASRNRNDRRRAAVYFRKAARQGSIVAQFGYSFTLMRILPFPCSLRYAPQLVRDSYRLFLAMKDDERRIKNEM